MLSLREEAGVGAAVAGLPLELVRRYEHWKDLVRLSGVPGVTGIRGFRDSSLDRRGRRASELGPGTRVVYRLERGGIRVLALEAPPSPAPGGGR